jgi:D-beta-D-heptose 7-phosphate kinase / D-beta-D-heptose 1-phosphate adenosyltransferase
MIAVIGDIMLDKYIYGSSTRKSPECLTAPVIKEYLTEHYIGGAGNTAINIQNLGQATKLFCALDKDSTLLELLCKENINICKVVNYSSDVVKTRIISNGEYIARLDYDTVIDCAEEKLVESLISSNPELIVLSDYNKGTINNCKNLIELANSKNINCLVDPKKELSEYAGAYLLKPNLKEFSDWMDWDTSLPDEDKINKINKATLDYALNTLKVKNLVITLGAHGCIVANKNQSKKIDALPVKAKDVTGAGDSFIAALAVSLYEQDSLIKSVEFATKVAGIAVTKKGTSYVKRNEI